VQKGKKGKGKAGKNISFFIWNRRQKIITLSSQSEKMIPEGIIKTERKSSFANITEDTTLAKAMVVEDSSLKL
jgi:hypothetical protein